MNLNYHFHIAKETCPVVRFMKFIEGSFPPICIGCGSHGNQQFGSSIILLYNNNNNKGYVVVVVVVE
jgi:hypothetical protein